MNKHSVRAVLWMGILIIVIIFGGVNPQPSLADGDLKNQSPTREPEQGEPTPEPPSEWLETIQDDLMQAEYNITWQEQTYLSDLPAAYQSPNRANNFRTYFSQNGPIVIPRTWLEVIETPPWRVEITLAAWGRTGMLNPVMTATLNSVSDESTANRIEYQRDQLVEWFMNDENGLEQGFTLSSSPMDGISPLQLDLAFSGSLIPQMNSTGDGIELLDSEGQPVLRYGGLQAFDAEGKSLPAWMVLEGLMLSLVVDDSGAVYPIEIDPLLTSLPSSASWFWNSSASNALFGYSVATAGDVNADGYSDVIIGLPYYDGGQSDEGRVAVFYGSASGLKVQTTGLEPDWVKESDRAAALYGYAVSTAGDVDGDNDCEIIVGAPGWNESSYDGAAWVYYGSSGGLNTVPGEYYHEEAGVTADFGFSVGFAGDVNEDHYSDIIIGAPARASDVSQAGEGAVFVYYGSGSGLSNIANWHAEGQQAGASLGSSVATAGDVNKDRFADVIAGAYLYDDGQNNEGKAFVWHGPIGGVNGYTVGTPDNSNWSAQINDADAHFGASVSTAGDVNGDGYTDVIVGAPYYTNGQTSEGAARLYLGSSTGLDTNYDNHDEGNDEGARFGTSVSTAGDVNGDGYADAIVGAPYYTNDSTDEGMAFVWYGHSDGISSSRDWDAEGNTTNAWFGFSVATAGDVNGDGYSDILVGAPGKNATAGSAYAYYGAADSLADDAGWTKASNLENAHFGHSVASAGDINADGYADIIVGGPQWDGGQAYEGIACIYVGSATGLLSAPPWCKEGDQESAYFGWSVSTAGDVNGDGYDDVIVGAPYYQYINHDNEGTAWVYHGSSSGLSTSPSWHKDSDQDDAQFGYAVGNAGDVNGDGYGDVIVGSPFYDSSETDEGGAWLYKGSAAGLISTPIWHAYGGQEGAEFGYDVGTAGDINADGYSDVIIGAPYWDNDENNEGGAWVYLGSKDGLSLTHKWRNDGDQIGANYGSSVSTAGDVNGDGHSDIIIGTPGWNGTYENEGKAEVYHSSGNSIYLSPSWTKVSNQLSAYFGYSFGSAGDVNGDGYADIIVGGYLWHDGETGEGGAWVYHGSSTGVISAPKWYGQGDQTSAHYGSSVAGAGDTNGDGYAEVVVGAPWYEVSHNQEGRAFVYYGNGGKGNSFGLYMINLTTGYVANLGELNSSGFRIYLNDNSPFGFGQIKYEVEVKPIRANFDGQNTTIEPATAWYDILLGSRVSTSINSVSQCAPFHWRMRIKYKPATTPFMPASRWMTIPWNGWNEMDARPSGVCVNLPVILRED